MIKAAHVQDGVVGREDLVHDRPEEDPVDVDDADLVQLLVEVDDPANQSKNLKFRNWIRFLW